MKVLYVRVSSIEQNTDRQKINECDFYLVEDKCSGSISFFDRPGGKEILKLISQDLVSSLTVTSIDRLGRNLKDILQTIEFFTERKISIHFINQGLTTLDINGNENPICNLMIGILGSVAQLEKIQIRERQLEGIKIAKLKGNVFLGRKLGSSEDVSQFLSKPKNKQALEYLKKGYNLTDTAKIVNLHINTLTKIRKFGLKK